MSAAVALKHEIKERVAAIVEREPCKVIALRTDTTPRHIAGLRRKEHGPGAAFFVQMCQHNAELRDWATQVMWLEARHDPRAAEALRQLVRRIEAEEST